MSASAPTPTVTTRVAIDIQGIGLRDDFGVPSHSSILGALELATLNDPLIKTFSGTYYGKAPFNGEWLVTAINNESQYWEVLLNGKQLQKGVNEVYLNDGQQNNVKFYYGSSALVEAPNAADNNELSAMQRKHAHLYANKAHHHKQ